MRQTKKGNAWHFGMTAHIGVDNRTKSIHSVAASAANLHDSLALPVLLHGKETCMCADTRPIRDKATSFTNTPRRLVT